MWHSGSGEINWLYSLAPSKGILILITILILHHYLDDNPAIICIYLNDNRAMICMYHFKLDVSHIIRVPIRRPATLGLLEISSLWWKRWQYQMILLSLHQYHHNINSTWSNFMLIIISTVVIVPLSVFDQNQWTAVSRSRFKDDAPSARPYHLKTKTISPSQWSLSPVSQYQVQGQSSSLCPHCLPDCELTTYTYTTSSVPFRLIQ